MVSDLGLKDPKSPLYSKDVYLGGAFNFNDSEIKQAQRSEAHKEPENDAISFISEPSLKLNLMPAPIPERRKKNEEPIEPLVPPTERPSSIHSASTSFDLRDYLSISDRMSIDMTQAKELYTKDASAQATPSVEVKNLQVETITISTKSTASQASETFEMLKTPIKVEELTATKIPPKADDLKTIATQIEIDTTSTAIQAEIKQDARGIQTDRRILPTKTLTNKPIQVRPKVKSTAAQVNRRKLPVPTGPEKSVLEKRLQLLEEALVDTPSLARAPLTQYGPFDEINGSAV